MSVYCVDCDHVESHGRKQATWHWLCLKFKRMPRGAIAPKILDVDPPYERCVDVNKFNNCNQFEPMKVKDDGRSSEEA